MGYQVLDSIGSNIDVEQRESRRQDGSRVRQAQNVGEGQTFTDQTDHFNVVL